MLFIISTLISTYAKEEELYENLAEVHADGNIVIIDDEGTTCDVTEEYCGMKYNLDYLKINSEVNIEIDQNTLLIVETVKNSLTAQKIR